MKSSACHEYRETVAALVLGELPRDQVPAVEQHRKTCPTCSKLYYRKNMKMTKPRLAKVYGNKPMD